MTITKTTSLVNEEANAHAALFAGGIIHIYSGVKPTSSEDAEVGVLLAKITNGGLVHTPGSAVNGLSYGTAVDGILTPEAGADWRGVWLADGEVSWFRRYDVDVVTGASATAIRYDGDVSLLATDDLQLNDINALVGGEVVVTTFPVVFSK